MWNFRGYLNVGGRLRAMYEADGAGGGTETPTEGNEDKSKATGADDVKQAEKNFTREQVNKMIAAEKAKAKEEAIKEFQKTLKLEKEEEERLSKLTAEDRLKESAKLYQEKYESERALRLELELKHDTIKALEDDGLPAIAVSLVMGKDAKATANNIKTLKEVISTSVEGAKPDWLKAKTPEGRDGKNKAWTMDDIRKMSTAEIQANLKEINEGIANKTIK
ncbi:MAG: DUF4355 domain-containing protein [Clostridia bacterium]|nr:DUF4355 domain-containing protein [Clostridia bacterium]